MPKIQTAIAETSDMKDLSYQLLLPTELKRSQVGGTIFGQDLDELIGRVAIDVFKGAGFGIRYTDCEQRQAPNALGLYIDSLSFPNNRSAYRLYLRELARSQGALSPKLYKWSEILTSDEPVVAKNRSTNRGEQKFLLSTENDKLRFLVFQRYAHAMAWNTFQTTKLTRMVAKDCLALKLALSQSDQDRSKAGARLINEIESELGSFEFEEYVTPNDAHNVSYRVLADAAGEVHYCLLLHKRTAPLTPPIDFEWADDPADMIVLNRARCRANYPLSLIYFTHPESPFRFDNPIDIVSNHAAGGAPIVISSLHSKISPYTDHQRAILAAQGFNPQAPAMPHELLEQAKRLCHVMRYEFPYGGIDFMRDSKGRFLFLEWNQLPGLCYEALGLSPETDDLGGITFMLEQVAHAFGRYKL